MYEEDYILRTIKDIARLLARIVFNKDTPTAGLEHEDDTETTVLFKDIIKLADNGSINEAEDLLYDSLDREKLDHYEFALAFYAHINEYTNQFLENSEYSRLEIKDGLQTITKEFGLSWVDNLI